jgi:NAD(P)-dependent dehydrogenase (short-subunit alcohol dehydrogenase family)
MDTNSDKRVVIVTGSTSGIGRGVAELLLSKGWRVVVNSRSDQEVGEGMAALSDDMIFARGDISNPKDCAQRLPPGGASMAWSITPAPRLTWILTTSKG